MDIVDGQWFGRRFLGRSLARRRSLKKKEKKEPLIPEGPLFTQRTKEEIF